MPDDPRGDSPAERPSEEHAARPLATAAVRRLAVPSARADNAEDAAKAVEKLGGTVGRTCRRVTGVNLYHVTLAKGLRHSP